MNKVEDFISKIDAISSPEEIRNSIIEPYKDILVNLKEFISLEQRNSEKIF